ncbi:hypothetical protein [Exiguobacterium sp.]|uniref:hypothetical protein n=1 Tax=Exiguobacterium sp. TaxID=44751 RepID=UPI00263B95C1|nr:hypothetical protein [Exiguobacterium sp.]MCC5893782.1 hypothetical protein [Exiguobacterium sp.]
MKYCLQELGDEYKEVTRLSQKLIDAVPDQIVLNVGNTTLLGVAGVKSKLKYIDESFQLLSDYLSYTFELHNNHLEISLQIYENRNNHFRINCFSKFGSKSGQLFSLNLTTSFENDLICVVQNRSAEVCNGNVHNSALLFLKRKRTCQQS